MLSISTAIQESFVKRVKFTSMKKVIMFLLLAVITVGVQAKVSIFAVMPKCEYTNDTSTGITKEIDSPIRYVSIDDDNNVFFYKDNFRWEEVMVTKIPDIDDYKNTITYWQVGTRNDRVAKFDYSNGKIIFCKFMNREISESWIFKIDIEATRRLR